MVHTYPGIMAPSTGSGVGSWLSGPGASDPGKYPGERLGMPESGPGSIARFGRRVAALSLDWLVSYGLAALAMTFGLISMSMLSTAVLGIWLALGVVSVRLFGFSPGQLVLGLRVVGVDGRPAGVGRALGRGLLIALVIPALFTDSDLRGLHDLATKTAVVKR